jgi:GNAT superfamily N-acetyltransferase
MARKLKLGPPSESIINELGFWYTLAGAVPDDLEKDVGALAGAYADGYLGCATGDGRKANFKRLAAVDFANWYYARMTLRALTLNDETIGMLVMGPPRRLWNVMAGRIAEMADAGRDASLAEDRFAIMALAVAKIYVVGVHPSQQRRGHGSRLMRHARELARHDGLIMVYGQYGPDRPHLRNFYASFDFRVLEQGEPLDLAWATGDDEYAAALPSETYFVWEGSQPDRLNQNGPLPVTGE